MNDHALRRQRRQLRRKKSFTFVSTAAIVWPIYMCVCAICAGLQIVLVPGWVLSAEIVESTKMSAPKKKWNFAGAVIWRGAKCDCVSAILVAIVRAWSLSHELEFRGVLSSVRVCVGLSITWPSDDTWFQLLFWGRFLLQVWLILGSRVGDWISQYK